MVLYSCNQIQLFTKERKFKNMVLFDKDAQAQLSATLRKENVSEDELTNAMSLFADNIQTKVLAEAEQYLGDRAELASRSGINLTSKEREYFMAVIESGEAFAGTTDLVPVTIINRVMDNLTKAHPLLAQVDMANVGLATEWIFSVGVNPAFWGALCADIKELQDKGFRKVSLSLYKLSAFMPVCKALLDLNSPEWLAQYVITVLTESIYLALENAIVDGTGKEMPVGMRRDAENTSAGEAQPIVATEIEGFTPQVAGNIMASLSKIEIETGVTIERTLAPSEILLMVNPQTYYKELFPNFTVQDLNGNYVQRLPLPFTIIEASAVPEGEILIGRGKDYFLGIGRSTQITTSDEVRFIEDERVYLAKMYGNGMPKFKGAFQRYTLKKPVTQ